MERPFSVMLDLQITKWFRLIDSYCFAKQRRPDLSGLIEKPSSSEGFEPPNHLFDT